MTPNPLTAKIPEKIEAKAEIPICCSSDESTINQINDPMATTSPADLVLSHQLLATDNSSVTELCGSSEDPQNSSCTNSEPEEMPPMNTDSATNHAARNQFAICRTSTPDQGNLDGGGDQDRDSSRIPHSVKRRSGIFKLIHCLI